MHWPQGLHAGVACYVKALLRHSTFWLRGTGIAPDVKLDVACCTDCSTARSAIALFPVAMQTHSTNRVSTYAYATIVGR